MATPMDPAKAAGILADFPSLAERVLDPDADLPYDYRAVSIFDGWLGEERAHELTTAEADYDVRSEPLDHFNSLLVTRTPAFRLVLDEPSPPALHEFASTEEATQYARHSPPDAEHSQLFRLILPDMRAVYLESWDFTNVFYLRDLSHLPLLADLAKQAGVYLFER